MKKLAQSFLGFWKAISYGKKVALLTVFEIVVGSLFGAIIASMYSTSLLGGAFLGAVLAFVTAFLSIIEPWYMSRR